MTGTHRITERFAFSGGKVCRESGTIADCLISGLVSENGRDYPAETYRRDFAKYEGAPSNCDHGRDDSIDRRLGWFADVKPAADGKPRGTFHLLKSHPMYERVMEAAERNPRLFGFSHVIEAKTSRRNGREIVESIERVISIDLVATPATTSSMFEGRTVISLTQFSERCGAKLGPKTWGALAKLCEDLGDMAAVPAMDDPPADADSPDLKGALMDALWPIVEQAFEDGTSAKAESALRDFIKLHAKHTGGAAADDDTPAEPADKTESKLPSLRDVIAECKGAKLTNPPIELAERLTTIADKDTRAFVIEQVVTASKGTGGEPVFSRGRDATERAAEAERKRLAESKAGAGEPSLDEIKKRMKG